MPDHRSRSLLLFVSTYLYPAVGFPLITYAWWRTSGGSWPLVAVVMAVPVIFGYLMPGVATQFIKRWRFTGGPRIGAYYLHHGFIYGSKLALALLAVVRSFATVVSTLDAVAVVVVAGATTAFGGWWHDVNAVRAGKIEVAGGLDALASFAPPSYFAMGATYAAVVLASERVLSTNAGAVAWVFPFAVVVMCVVPSLVFLAVDPPTRALLRERWTSPQRAGVRVGDPGTGAGALRASAPSTREVSK
jgi:hypothetical protein